MHHVDDANKGYEKTVLAAIIQNGEVADDSSRKAASSGGLKTDIFGEPNPYAQSAHLLPHGPSCAPFWFPVVPWVLCTEKRSLTWIFMQKCIHGTKGIGNKIELSNVDSGLKDRRMDLLGKNRKKSLNTVSGLHERKIEPSTKWKRKSLRTASGSQLTCSSRKKVPKNRSKQSKAKSLHVDGGSVATGSLSKAWYVGIKHFLTNRIRLTAQGTYLDSIPCVIIVPIMQSVAEVKSWNGTAYDAIVLAGRWEEIGADTVYKGIQASGSMQHGNFVNYLANMIECDAACFLLEQMILSVCHVAFSNSTEVLLNLDGNKHLVDWNKTDKYNLLKERMAPVPASTGNWNNKMLIRKISFANSNETDNPAPDPALLLARAASNYLKRQGIGILPVW